MASKTRKTTAPAECLAGDGAPGLQREATACVIAEDAVAESQQPGTQAGQHAVGTIRFRPLDDILLLRQLVADRPWAAERGGQLAAYNAVAENLRKSVPRFGQFDVDGRSVYHRFSLLLKAR
jgi:hypothetical protein